MANKAVAGVISLETKRRIRLVARRKILGTKWPIWLEAWNKFGNQEAGKAGSQMKRLETKRQERLGAGSKK